MFIDTHCHLNYQPLLKNAEAFLEEAYDNNVQKIICVATDIQNTLTAIKLADKYDFVYATAGFHPHDIESAKNGWLKEIERLLQHDKVVAIGEIGLDFYRDYSPRELQLPFFTKQLELAKSLNMPVIIHNRNADDETRDIINKVDYYNSVLHCFGSNAEYAVEMIQKGLHISFTGNVTYRSKKTEKAVKAVPIEKLMLETDAPFLSPSSKRGKTNVPANIPLIAEKIAELKEISIDEVELITTENAVRFFNL